MKYLLAIVTALYALLSIFAAAVQIKSEEKKDTPTLMITGGIFLIGAAVIMFLDASFDFIFAITGSISISIAAFLNGRRSSNFHTRHHIIRSVLSLILIVGFICI